MGQYTRNKHTQKTFVLQKSTTKQNRIFPSSYHYPKPFTFCFLPPKNVKKACTYFSLSSLPITQNYVRNYPICVQSCQLGEMTAVTLMYWVSLEEHAWDSWTEIRWINTLKYDNSLIFAGWKFRNLPKEVHTSKLAVHQKFFLQTVKVWVFKLRKFCLSYCMQVKPKINC